ncbi:MAG: hypothetical protein KDD61_07795, partial [Bdellovibrionales bacterium]|nr:hypothetical protein [Bdellovibrionales bacterium]
MKMGEFLNPKNTWAIIHCKRILEEFLGLLIEMNSASKALSFRYEMIKFGEPEGAARDFSFDKEGNMQKFALEGVGAALIIGTDSLIKGVLTLSEGSKEIEKGPVVGKVLWIELIRTCGNFVRHGKEW